MEDKKEENTKKELSVEQALQKAFGNAVVNVSFDEEVQLSESVSMFLRAMDEGKARAAKSKIAFGE